MAKSVIGALRVMLTAETAQFKAAMSDAQSQMRRMGARMQRIGRNLSASITVPIVGLGAGVLKVAGDFEASMNRVQAVLNASESEFKALREEARRMGRETQFSASEAADGIEILAKNGLSAAQILGGALQSSMTLAAAQGANLAVAGDIATDVMLAFGKEAKDLGKVVDGVAGTLSSSKFNIDDYRLALGQAGGVAGGIGVELDDFNAVLAATAERFSGGSDAATSFKTFLVSLSGSSGPAAKEIERLGLEFFDARGNIKSMADVAEELKRALSGLSEEARINSLQAIFGRDAMRTAIALMAQGADGINRFKAEIGDVSAENLAAARMKGLNGELRKLRSAFEELMLVIAESGVLAAFTDFVVGLTGVVRWLGELNPRVVKTGVALAGLAAIVGPLVIVIGGFTAALGAISGTAAVVVGAIAGLTAAVIAFWPEIKKLAELLWNFAEETLVFVGEQLDMLGQAFVDLKDTAIEAVSGLVTGVESWMNENRFGRVIMAPLRPIQTIKGAFKDLHKAVVGNSYIPDMVEGVEKWMRRLAGSMPRDAARAVDGAASELQQVESISQSIGESIRGSFEGVYDDIFRGTFDLRRVLRGLLADIGKITFRRGITGLFGAIGIPGFANGTMSAPGGLAMVGERGPELVNLPRGSQVIPNHELGDAMPAVAILDNRRDFAAWARSRPGRVVMAEVAREEGWFSA